MPVLSRPWPVLLSLTLCGGLAMAQGPPAGEQIPPPAPPPVPKAETPPPADAVAAVVNGQPIPELAVFRGLLRVAPQFREKARPEVLNYLIDNVIIDQYLAQLKIAVEPKEVDENIERIKGEAQKAGQDFPTMLKKLHLSEEELRRELTGALRWDKFVLKQGEEKVLRDLFEKNPEMFNGARVQARHILIPVADGKKGEAEARAQAIRKQIEQDATQELAKLPAGADKIAVEKERVRALEKAFAAAAAKESVCPSKVEGGDLGYFPRVGALTEPFARAAFALKPYQLSEPVHTEFGVHLILALDHKPGKEVKFEDVRRFVSDVYAERLREAIVTNYKPRSKVEIRDKK
jgi:peptidyl-prolyl cis-trans isomerase C